MYLGFCPLLSSMKIDSGLFQATDESQLDHIVRLALDVGYRYFDTAAMYGNEQVIGRVLEEYVAQGKVKREDLFITSKLSLNGHAEPAKHIEESLSKLRTHIDLYLIHTATPMKCNSVADLIAGKAEIDLTPHHETWKVMEKFYNDGQLKALGVSNFNPEQVQDLFDRATVKPANKHNNQVECHILHPQRELHDLCRRLGMTLTAYAPIGSPGRPAALKNGVKDEENPMKHPLTLKLAQKYRKTPAQILIRQMMQRGISTIPKSTNDTRLKENFDVLDFELSEEEMHEFDEIKEDKQLFLSEIFKAHPYHPWKPALRRAGLID